MSGRRSTRNKEARVEVKLRIPRSRLAVLDADCKTLCTTRNSYFEHLLDLAPLALDRHQTANSIAALQFQLWELQRMDHEGRLDHDLAQTIVRRVDDVARQITRRLRLGE